MQMPSTPWTAPSAAVYAADGLPVCTLGTVEMTKAYRARGDGAGRMMADTAYLIAAAPALLEALQDALARLESFIGSDCECDNTHEQNHTVCCLCEYRAAIALT